METNLIFKRQVAIDGVTRVVTRIVHVDIPNIDSGEGWVLSGHTDTIEVCEGVHSHPVATKSDPQEVIIDMNTQSVVEGDAKSTDSTKFESNVKGTAKLVRSRGAIKIVARRGKSTYNQTTLNSVCIDDCTKNNFFKDCRSVHGNSGVYELRPSDGRCYDYWNDVLDKEYQRQKDKFNHTKVS